MMLHIYKMTFHQLHIFLATFILISKNIVAAFRFILKPKNIDYIPKIKYTVLIILTLYRLIILMVE